MKKSATDILKEAWIGKKLVNLEYRDSDGPEIAIYGRTITQVELTADEGGNPKIYLDFEGEDSEPVEVYANEDVTVEV